MRQERSRPAIKETPLLCGGEASLKQFKGKSVGFTLYTLNDKVARIFQPKASLPNEKIKALKILYDSGIETYIHVGPYLPEITNLEEILKKTKDRINFFEGEMLNTRGANFTTLALVLKTHFPILSCLV